MKLSIKYLPHMKRCWLLKRERGKYSQHAHFYTKKDARNCRKLIDNNKFPQKEKYKIAMKRILTKEEYSNLSKERRKNAKNIYK